MRREPLDMYDERPREMKAYLSNFGWSFNRKLCDFAVSLMKKTNPSTGKKERIEPISKEKVDELLLKYGVKLENNTLYNYVYWANQGKADLLKSSVPDEAHLASYIKDMVDDPDAPDGMAMAMWYAKMCRAGEPIEWDEML